MTAIRYEGYSSAHKDTDPYWETEDHTWCWVPGDEFVIDEFGAEIDFASAEATANALLELIAKAREESA